MPESTLTDVQADHRHWLQDVDRWENYLGTWNQEKEDFVEAAKSFQLRIEQFCADLKTYAQTLESHRQEIARAERLALEASDPDEEALAKDHDKRETHHEALHRLHHRLQHRYHEISAQLASIRPAGK